MKVYPASEHLTKEFIVNNDLINRKSKFMVTALAEGLHGKYELLKKRYKDGFQNSTMIPQIRVKSLNEINDKSSRSNADLGRSIDELLSEIALTDHTKDLLKGQYSKVQDYYRHVQYYTKEQVHSKAIELKGSANLDIYLVTEI